MRKLLTLLICLPLFTTAQQTINGSITHNGLQRDYIIHIPSSYNMNTSIPLVFCFHGLFLGEFANISWFIHNITVILKNIFCKLNYGHLHTKTNT